MKGMEISSYDPRGAYGQALSYATSNRGGCHMDAWSAGAEYAMQLTPVHTGTMKRLSKDGKPIFIKNLQDFMAMLNSLIMCIFSTYVVTMEQLALLISKATGIDMTKEELTKVGERIFILERMFNAREEFGRKDDILPSRFLEEPLGGPSKKSVVPLEEMLDEYYALRGFDDDGHPTEEKMKELGL
jgi:aldehyde:ferredoxin oxidoreductase